VLCNPRDAQGRNAAPSSLEVANCRPFLRETLELIAAPIVVSLGRVALAALESISPHGLVLRHDVGRVVPWAGRLLMPLYHPGPRAQLHRTFAQQQEDFAALAQLVTASNAPCPDAAYSVVSGASAKIEARAKRTGRVAETNSASEAIK
jgi:uracil-DNA glycosylase